METMSEFTSNVITIRSISFLLEIMKRTDSINKSNLTNPDKLMHIFIFENLECNETIQVFRKQTELAVLA